MLSQVPHRRGRTQGELVRQAVWIDVDDDRYFDEPYFGDIAKIGHKRAVQIIILERRHILIDVAHEIGKAGDRFRARVDGRVAGGIDDAAFQGSLLDEESQSLDERIGIDVGIKRDGARRERDDRIRPVRGIRRFTDPLYHRFDAALCRGDRRRLLYGIRIRPIEMLDGRDDREHDTRRYRDPDNGLYQGHAPRAAGARKVSCIRYNV